MEAAEGGDDDFEDVPMQLRLELRLLNQDPEGSAPMVFQVCVKDYPCAFRQNVALLLFSVTCVETLPLQNDAR